MPAYTGTLTGAVDWESSVIAYGITSTTAVKTHGVDVFINKTVTATHSVDVLIQKTRTVSHGADVYITPPVVPPPPGDPMDFSYRTVLYSHSFTQLAVASLGAKTVVYDAPPRQVAFINSFTREVTP